ncbi:MAG TPA: DUF63 family protein [archaeon]|nr:DUF63 family protein [archaeon]
MGILQAVQDFVYKYYIIPIITDVGYNPVNTITWAIILGICILGVLKLLEKIKVEADWEFIKVIIPYVVAGSILRVFEDADMFVPPIQYLFITPPIYLLMFVITVSLLFLSIKLRDFGVVDDWKKAFGAGGILWAVINFGILLLNENIVNPAALVFIPALAIGITSLIYLIAKKTGNTMFTQRINVSILLVHMLDASSTFYGVDFLNYIEKHVVPIFMIDLAGTASVMLPLKLLIFIPVIYILDTRFEEDEESRKLKDLMKLTIIVLGLAPATRNTISMLFAA